MRSEDAVKQLRSAVLNANVLGCKVCSIEVHKLENALSVMSKQGTEIYRLKRTIEILKKEKKND